jgi:hypothetical protein
MEVLHKDDLVFLRTYKVKKTAISTDSFIEGLQALVEDLALNDGLLGERCAFLWEEIGEELAVTITKIELPHGRAA